MKILGMLLSLCFVFLLSGLLLAANAPASTPTDDPAAILSLIVSYFSSGSWALGASAVITLLTYLGGSVLFKKYIPSAALPWISIGLGVASAIVVSIAGGMVWWKALINGVFIGNAASGLWSAVLKYFLPQPVSEASALKAVNKAEVIVAKVQIKTPEFVPRTPKWVAK